MQSRKEEVPEESRKSGKVEVQEETYSFNIKDSEMRCPILVSYFFEPAQVSCGHMFERDAIEKWFKTNPTCPLCREQIETIVKPAMFFRNVLEEIFRKKPQLNEDRYFNFTILHDALRDYDTLMEKGETDLDKLKKIKNIVTLLKYNKYFVSVSENDKYYNSESENKDQIGGYSGFELLCESTLGCQLLAEDKELRSRISAKDLNTIFTGGTTFKGVPVLTVLMINSQKNLDKLLDDKEFLSKITPEGLNNIGVTDKGLNDIRRSTSPLMFLLANIKGVKLIAEDEELRSKITSEGLNAALSGGPSKGVSTLYLLLISLLKREEWLIKIFQDKAFLSKITPESLNATVPGGPNEGLSPLWIILANHNLLFPLLRENKELRSKITSKNLNAVMPTGAHKGISPLMLLLEIDEGLDLLAEDEELRSKITSESLNAIMLRGKDKGKTIAEILAKCLAPDSKEEAVESKREEQNVESKIHAEMVEGGHAHGLFNKRKNEEKEPKQEAAKQDQMKEQKRSGKRQKGDLK